MRKMVFNVSAESGGALSILNDFYNEYKNDKYNEYIFVVSKPEIYGTPNIKVLRYPWIKKSWIHRLFFDHLIAPKLIKKYKVEEVLSLQNIIIPHTKVPQVVYIHNALPFSEYRFSIFDDKLLWVYQNILSISIFNSIRKAYKVIVQTEWMKNKCIEKLNFESMKIEVLPPKIDIEVKKQFSKTKESMSTFFYPASGMVFKNHKIIIEACIKLKELGIDNYKVIFTLKGDENKHIIDLYKIVKDYELPIEFVGNIPREAVFDYYTRSVLIFPSYIETFGIPLIEAKAHETPVLVSDCNFSHEVLNNYDRVEYFNSFDYTKLSFLMRSLINKLN